MLFAKWWGASPVEVAEWPCRVYVEGLKMFAEFIKAREEERERLEKESAKAGKRPERRKTPKRVMVKGSLAAAQGFG